MSYVRADTNTIKPKRVNKTAYELFFSHNYVELHAPRMAAKPELY